MKVNDNCIESERKMNTDARKEQGLEKVTVQQKDIEEK